MKKYFKLLMVALFATLSFTLVSCGDDDDNDALVGTWELTEIEDDGDVYYTIITFNKNNTLAMSEIWTNGDGDDSDIDNYTGTYLVDGDVKKGAAITVNFIDEDGDTWTESGSVRVDGKSLYATLDGDSKVFTKK